MNRVIRFIVGLVAYRSRKAASKQSGTSRTSPMPKGTIHAELIYTSRVPVEAIEALTRVEEPKRRLAGIISQALTEERDLVGESVQISATLSNREPAEGTQLLLLVHTDSSVVKKKNLEPIIGNLLIPFTNLLIKAAKTTTLPFPVIYFEIALSIELAGHPDHYCSKRALLDLDYSKHILSEA